MISFAVQLFRRLQAQTNPPPLGGGGFSETALSFLNEDTLPNPSSDKMNERKLSKREIKKYEDKYAKWIESVGENQSRLLGHPYIIQSDMKTECELVSNGINPGDTEGRRNPIFHNLKRRAKEWRLLLQVGSNEQLGSMWGDSGMIYFWIKQGDLRRRNFDNVWLILQCY